MGPPGVAMGAEDQRGEGRLPEKQGMGWGMWGQELDLGARLHSRGWSRTTSIP